MLRKSPQLSRQLILPGGEEGHVSRECNAPQKEKACYRCNEVGHLSRECPNTGAGGGGGGGGMGGGYSGGGGGQECYKVIPFSVDLAAALTMLAVRQGWPHR